MFAPRSLTAAARPRTTTRILNNALAPNFFRGQTRTHASALPKPQPAFEGHVPLNWFEYAFLSVGSALRATPATAARRTDNPMPMVEAVSEETAGAALPRLRDVMLSTDEGRRVLRDRPYVNSKTIDLVYLSKLPEHTFGRAFVTFLDRCGITPDQTDPVSYIPDPELAYVMQRYRDAHDFYHVLAHLPVTILPELALKYFEFANLGLSTAALRVLGGPLRLSPDAQRRLDEEFIPWAMQCGQGIPNLIGVYWEDRWEMSLEDVRREFGVWTAPEVKWVRTVEDAYRVQDERIRKAVMGLPSGGEQEPKKAGGTSMGMSGMPVSVIGAKAQALTA